MDRKRNLQRCDDKKKKLWNSVDGGKETKESENAFIIQGNRKTGNEQDIKSKFQNTVNSERKTKKLKEFKNLYI